KGEVPDVLIPWIRTVRLQLRERFGTDLPVLRLHSDRGGEFSSNLLRDFCCGEGILQSFKLPASPQQNGIAERRIGLVMEVASTSMIHAIAPYFLWSFAVGDASVFRVWGSRAFVHDTSADKLSARAIPCVFLGFVPDVHGWQFYHPTLRRVLPSQDVTFDESVPFYDPLRGTAHVQIAVGSGATPGAVSGDAASGGAEPGDTGSEGAGSGGAEPGGAKLEGVAPGGAESEGAESGGAAPRGAALSGGPAGASLQLSSQQLREWLVRRAHRRSGAPRAGGAGDTRARGAAVTTRAGGTGGTAATGPGGARTSGARAAGTGGVGCTRAGDPTELGAASAGGTGAGGAGVRGPDAGGAEVQQVLGVLSSTGLPTHFPCPPPDHSQLPLQPASPLHAPSPYTEQSGGLTERREPVSRPVSPVRTACRAPRSRPPLVPGTHAMALRPSSIPLRVPLPAPPQSSLPELLDIAAACRLDCATALVAESVSASPPSVGGECALGTDVLEDRQEEFECLAAAVPRFASMLLAPEGDPDAPDIPTPRSYAEAITGPYSSQWQAAMDAEMAFWKSTGTYIDEVPLSRANIVDGMWIFRGVDYFQTFSPTPKMTTQRDYELHSLNFSSAFLQGSVHEEIWLRRPPGFTGTFLAGTQWSLRRPVYNLRQAPRKWHDTLRTTLVALGFAPSTADPSLFLRTDTSLPPVYVLVYVVDLVFATADTEALTLVKLELQKRHTCTDLGPLALRLPLLLATAHSSVYQPLALSSIEPSGPYPELVGCLMYLMTCRRPDLVYPLSLLARYVAPVRWAWGLCLEDGVYSSCEAEIYAGAMAAQELRWLTYLLVDLGEQARSPPVLYVDNKAMIALCKEHRLEHRTKHIALRYFLAQELQHRGQLCLAYVATRANTADVFTKALPPGDHQRFATVLGLVPTLPHLLTA
ncbi:unnamed protein product, partial [Closterium sp. NIES-53]